MTWTVGDVPALVERSQPPTADRSAEKSTGVHRLSIVGLEPFLRQHRHVAGQRMPCIGYLIQQAGC